MPSYRVGDRLRLRDPHLEVPEYVVTSVAVREGRTTVVIKGGHFGELEAQVTEGDLDTSCDRVSYRIGDQLRLRHGDPEAAPIVVVDVRGDTVQLAGLIGESAGLFEFDVASVDEVCERVVHAPSPHWPVPKRNILPEQVPIKAPTARSAWDWLNSSEDEE